MHQRLSLGIFVLVQLTAQLALCDTFSVREDTGNTAVIDARLIGERPGAVALERADGRIELVPQQLILKRKVGPDPEPISCTTMIERLTEEFGAKNFRAYSEEPYVVALVLSEPLPMEKKFESNVTTCLKKGVKFMQRIEKEFLAYTKDLKLDTDAIRFPLVVLVFETDDDFIKFHTQETGGHGLSAESTQGYYSRLTNRLVIRMSECFTFATPLHEAIHQQVYNRGLLQRISPIPVWFDEGIATGFEGDGKGTNIKNGPKSINTRYALKAMQAKSVNWDEVITNDKAFRGDVLAGEAYANAWSLHWFLLTKYRQKYVDFLKILHQKPPLQIDDEGTRTQDFERAFDKSITELQREFPAWLEQAAIKQKVTGKDRFPDGYLIQQTNLAQVEMTSLKNPVTGELESEGKMRNISQIRPVTFHITMETDGGAYAEWFLPNVTPMKLVTLPKQIARKQMKDSPNRPATKFWIKVKSVISGSETDLLWQRGQLPIPVWKNN